VVVKNVFSRNWELGDGGPFFGSNDYTIVISVIIVPNGETIIIKTEFKKENSGLEQSRFEIRDTIGRSAFVERKGKGVKGEERKSVTLG
jgi:hypothetical protein